MKVRFVVGVLAALAIAGGGQARSSAGTSFSLRPCGATTPVLCGTLTVPLDLTGRHSGSVNLHVEELPSPFLEGTLPRRVLFLIAGGPGQASADAFDLRDDGAYYQQLMPGYTLVAYDDRGTGKSDAISCPGLERSGESPFGVGACGQSLGMARSYYTTRENAADMDAIRQALGVDKIALFGASYGTRQETGYALSYPKHVERIIFDSVTAPSWPESFPTLSLKRIPDALDALCLHVCQGVTRHAGADFAKLANRLQAAPVTARVSAVGGRMVSIRLDGDTLLSLAYATDLDPGTAAEFPAAIAAGLHANLLPLERLTAVAEYSGTSDLGGSFSDAVNIATECADGQFPWSSTTAVAKRDSLLGSALLALGRHPFGQLGTWAAFDGIAQQCEDWPASPPVPTVPKGPFPKVPVLLLSGSRDIRTPTTGARLLANRFKGSRLLVVANSGHDVSQESGCAAGYITAWIEGRHHAKCPRIALPFTMLGPFPSPTDTAPLDATQTRDLIVATIREADATAGINGGLLSTVTGLVGGRLREVSRTRVLLQHYSDAPGVILDGDIALSDSGQFLATLKVSGDRAAHGKVVELDGKLTGTLGGHRVNARVSALR